MRSGSGALAADGPHESGGLLLCERMEDLTTMILSVSYTQDAVQKEWQEWLGRVFGSKEDEVWLVTFTFRKPVLATSSWTRPGKSLVQAAALRLDAKLAALGMTWFGVEEAGADTQRLHLHYLVKWPRSDSGNSKWLRVLRLWWERDYGFTNGKEVLSREGVSMYVVKYVTKTGGAFWTGGGPGWH